MFSQLDNGIGSAEQRARIEKMLAQYPDISPNHLAALITWFRKEASALDVALIASNEAIAQSYRRFRNDHIDPLTVKDLVNGFLVIASAAALIFISLIWPAL